MALKNTSAIIKTMTKQLLALEALQGCKTADDVFNILKEAKVKGKGGNEDCPVAVYLLKAGFTDVSVGGDGDVELSEVVTGEFQLPPAVKQFIKRFDNLPSSDDDDNVDSPEVKAKQKAVAKGGYAHYGQLVAKD